MILKREELKKYGPTALIVAVLVVVGGSFALVKSARKDNAVSEQPQQQTYSVKKACDVFTTEDAKKVLGDGAAVTPMNEPKPTSDTVEVTQCSYAQGDKQATLLSRSAKSDLGRTSNQEVFTGSQRPADAQAVEGYGDSAYWAPALGQLNIYKSGNWYIMTISTGKTDARSLDETKKLADTVIEKL